MSTPTDSPRPVRSSFVTVVGWLFALLAGSCTVTHVQMGLASLHLWIEPELRKRGPDTPAWLAVFIHALPWLWVGVLVTLIGLLAASIGLLRRRPAARVWFIRLMGVCIAWNLLAVLLFYLYASWSLRADPEIEWHDPVFRLQAVFLTVLFVGGPLLWARVLAWIAKNLATPEVRRDFDASQP